MDTLTIFMWVIGGVCGVLGWLARELYAAVKSLREDLQKLEVRVGTDYITYDRLQDALKPVNDSLHEIKMTLGARGANRRSDDNPA